MNSLMGQMMLAIAYGWSGKAGGVSEIGREDFDSVNDAMRFIKNTLAAPYGAGRFVKMCDEYYATEWSDLKYGVSFKKLDETIYILPMRKVIALAGVSCTPGMCEIYCGLMSAGPHAAAICSGIPAVKIRAVREICAAESRCGGNQAHLTNLAAARGYVESL